MPSKLRIRRWTFLNSSILISSLYTALVVDEGVIVNIGLMD
jgi:hypothetical protein